MIKAVAKGADRGAGTHEETGGSGTAHSEEQAAHRVAQGGLPAPASEMVARPGFEPGKAEPTDLQSVPFGRSGISPTGDLSGDRCKRMGSGPGAGPCEGLTPAGPESQRSQVILGSIRVSREHPSCAAAQHGRPRLHPPGWCEALFVLFLSASVEASSTASRPRNEVPKGGASGGTRTRNLLITNQLLCQLSHAGEAPGEAPSPQFQIPSVVADGAWLENGAAYSTGDPWRVKHPDGFSGKRPGKKHAEHPFRPASHGVSPCGDSVSSTATTGTPAPRSLPADRYPAAVCPDPETQPARPPPCSTSSSSRAPGRRVRPSARSCGFSSPGTLPWHLESQGR